MLNRLDALQKYKRLILLDLMYKINHLKQPLYTFQVRNPGGTFLPVTYLLTDGEDSNILVATIQQIKKAYNKKRHKISYQQPQYFFTDNSAAEQLAIKKAFHGTYKNEDEVIHLLYQVHSRQTLKKRVKNQDIRKEIYSTFYYHTTEAFAKDAVN